MSGYTQIDDGIYISDAPVVPRRTCCGGNGLGILGLLVSVLGIPTFGLFSPLGLLLSLFGLLRRPRGAAVMGTILGGLGTAFLTLAGWAIISSVMLVDNAARLHETEAVMQQGIAAIEQYERDHGQLPDGIDGNKVLIAAELNDAWGESLRYDADGKVDFLLRSAGPDRQFDTFDDIVAWQ